MDTQGELERLTRALAQAQRELAHYRRKDELLALQGHGAAFDLAAELAEAEAMTEPQWQQHRTRIAERYARADTSAGEKR